MSDGLHESFHKGIIKRQAEQIERLRAWGDANRHTQECMDSASEGCVAEARLAVERAGHRLTAARADAAEARLAAVLTVCAEYRYSGGATFWSDRFDAAATRETP